MCATTLRVDFATAASQNGFQYIYKLPFIRKTKIFRKTKKHWKIDHFHLETRLLYDTFVEFMQTPFCDAAISKIHRYVASSFNVQTSERRHGDTGVLTCLTGDKWLNSQLSSSCQGRRCGRPFAASITVQITPLTLPKAQLGRTPLRFSPLSFRLCVAHAQLITR